MCCNTFTIAWKYLKRLCSCVVMTYCEISTHRYTTPQKCVVEEQRTYFVHSTYIVRTVRTVRSVSTVRTVWCGTRKKFVGYRWLLLYPLETSTLNTQRFFWSTQDSRRRRSEAFSSTGWYNLVESMANPRLISGRTGEPSSLIAGEKEERFKSQTSMCHKRSCRRPEDLDACELKELKKMKSIASEILRWDRSRWTTFKNLASPTRHN